MYDAVGFALLLPVLFPNNQIYPVGLPEETWVNLMEEGVQAGPFMLCQVKLDVWVNAEELRRIK